MRDLLAVLFLIGITCLAWNRPLREYVDSARGVKPEAPALEEHPNRIPVIGVDMKSRVEAPGENSNRPASGPAPLR